MLFCLKADCILIKDQVLFTPKYIWDNTGRKVLNTAMFLTCVFFHVSLILLISFKVTFQYNDFCGGGGGGGVFSSRYF